MAEAIRAALHAHGVDAVVVVIPGSRKLYGTATFLGEMEAGKRALELVAGVTVRRVHPQLGLVTFDYVPQEVKV